MLEDFETELATFDIEDLISEFRAFMLTSPGHLMRFRACQQIGSLA